MLVLNGLIGLLLLIFGRRLFWLAVGALGFLAGLSLAAPLVEGQPDWVLLAVALAGGAAGGLLALFVQRIAIWLAGFLAGGYFGVSLLEAAAGPSQSLPWLAFLIGGLAGVVLMAALFDWALIILSSLAGAGLTAQALQIDEFLTILIFTVLAVLGMAVQARLLRRERRTRLV